MMTRELLGRFLDLFNKKYNISLKYSLQATIFQSLQNKDTKTSTLRRHANYLNVHNDTICIRKLHL